MSEPTGTATPSTPAPRPPSRVQVTWAGAHVFDGQLAAGGPSIRMDGSGQLGPNMVAVVCIALAGCTGVDVVDILAKRRTPIEAMTVDVEGARGHPRTCGALSHCLRCAQMGARTRARAHAC
jgi:putative redox protein